ncbi:biotin--acetyl-CoA-carboxylase ligase [Bifidobacterium sp. ESL0790]|uniref:biotin--[acetyl-CoA-carboxylase] ligase n=1 Tax=Bifidobacterium sp. ESL0790 TaxID=2983233 RepID=UPI0023F8706D|nr:biotin--acetyl-CoA-carboxylase ligase [Bifidobacterium sp. ESL0790]WEV72243.1 biotin--acetyl-CoA-carboxylase ligase [Bifidobacterium sp. ESL0790]
MTQNPDINALDRRIDAVRREYGTFAEQAKAMIPEMPRTERAADEVIALAGVDSTNILGRELLANGSLKVVAEGKPRMAAICADAQTAGHGRLGRKWSDKAGSSFLVTYITALPKCLVADPELNGWFTMAAGLAALDALNGALAECGAEPIDPAQSLMLKWPNDIFHDGHKLGGILAELVELPEGMNRLVKPKDAATTAEASNAEQAGATNGIAESAQPSKSSDATTEPAVGVMFGIGINLDLPADALPTPISTSLQLLYRNLPDSRTMRDTVAARLATSLRRRLAALSVDPQTELPNLLEETRANCWTLGREVEAKFTDGTRLKGRAVSLNPDASLTIEDESGTLQVVKTADVGVLA